MIVETAQITLRAPWVHSLKEKRMEVKSIIAKVQNKFNVSIAEIDDQDIHQTIVLGIALLSDTLRLAGSSMDRVIAFIESTSEAEITDIRREIR